VVVKVRKRLAVSKQAQELDVVRLNLRNLSELKVRKQYWIKTPNRFAALENLCDSKDIKRTWENIKENIRTLAKERLGLYELKPINHGLMMNVKDF
jgi:hypothetical protein